MPAWFKPGDVCFIFLATGLNCCLVFKTGFFGLKSEPASTF